MAGRRERNKLERRRTIQLAGLRLFAKRGYDETTLVEIAESADVALRTVSLYFATKLEIALSPIDEILKDVAPAFDAQGHDLDYLDALERWLRGVVRGLDVEMLTLVGQTFERNAGLGAVARERMQPALGRNFAILSAELGGPGQEFNAEILGVTIRAIVAHIIIDVPSEDADQAISSAWTFLRAGMAALKHAESGSTPAIPPVGETPETDHPLGSG